MHSSIPFHVSFEKKSISKQLIEIIRQDTHGHYDCFICSNHRQLTGTYGLFIDLEWIKKNKYTVDDISAIRSKYKYVVFVTPANMSYDKFTDWFKALDPHNVLRSDFDSFEVMCALKNVRDYFTSMERDSIMLQILENAENSIVITDLDGNIKYANPYFEEITGYKRDEFIGKNPRIIKSGEHPPQFYQNLWDKITTRTLWEGIFINKNKTGGYFYEEARITHINDINDNINGYLKIGKQVERERLLTDELNQEMIAAKEIMINMLPESYKTCSISFDYVLKPFNYLGGDFISFVKASETHYLCALIDVMGHGVSSTLVGLKSISLFQALAKDFSLDHIVQTINEMIVELNNDSEMTSKYLSGIFFDIDLTKKECHYISAGHPDFLVFNYNDTVNKILSNNLLIGIHKDYHYRVETLDLNAISKILFYTDGAIENPKFSDINAGLEELLKIINAQAKAGSHTLHYVMDKLTYGTELKDDCAICELKFNNCTGL